MKVHPERRIAVKAADDRQTDENKYSRKVCRAERVPFEVIDSSAVLAGHGDETAARPEGKGWSSRSIRSLDDRETIIKKTSRESETEGSGYSMRGTARQDAKPVWIDGANPRRG